MSAIKLAVLISGSGTTLQNLLDQIHAGQLNASVHSVVASRPGIKGIDRARAAQVPCHLVDRKQFTTVNEFSAAVFAHCQGADLVCLAGWLSLLELPAQFEGRVMNIHPALLPLFGGRGMYGMRVHQAVLDHGCKVSGCTVHFVDNGYDSGPIIVQRSCPVLDDDTPETLAHRVFEQEKLAYPEAIRLYQAGKLKIDGRRVRIAP